jgi:hypothetical protein
MAPQWTKSKIKEEFHLSDLQYEKLHERLEKDLADWNLLGRKFSSGVNKEELRARIVESLPRFQQSYYGQATGNRAPRPNVESQLSMLTWLAHGISSNETRRQQRAGNDWRRPCQENLSSSARATSESRKESSKPWTTREYYIEIQNELDRKNNGFWRLRQFLTAGTDDGNAPNDIGLIVDNLNYNQWSAALRQRCKFLEHLHHLVYRRMDFNELIICDEDMWRAALQESYEEHNTNRAVFYIVAQGRFFRALQSV